MLIAIIAMSVGYAALAQVLNINGTANITALWNVEITNIELKDSIGAKNKKIPTYDERTASFDVDLSYPGASATYIVKVENKGTVDTKQIQLFVAWKMLIQKNQLLFITQLRQFLKLMV